MRLGSSLVKNISLYNGLCGASEYKSNVKIFKGSPMHPKLKEGITISVMCFVIMEDIKKWPILRTNLIVDYLLDRNMIKGFFNTKVSKKGNKCYLRNLSIM